MTVYVDTSVVVRVLLREPNPVQIWGQWNKAYSSALWRVEALRTADRLRLTHGPTVGVRALASSAGVYHWNLAGRVETLSVGRAVVLKPRESNVDSYPKNKRSMSDVCGVADPVSV
jgi:predicted nucleic acid-binding protein